MHFEILVEDASGMALLDAVLPKILGPQDAPHTFRIHPYKGVGRIPKGMKPKSQPRSRILLDRLPQLLRGYGKSLSQDDAAVVVVVDQDRHDCHGLKGELLAVAACCRPAPRTLFRIAVEEMEAWLLGDRGALLAAYPRAKTAILDRYRQDAICDTWELLADAIHPGGAKALLDEGWPAPGRAKCEWATRIGPHMEVAANRSKSFQVLVRGLQRMAGS